MTSRPAGLDLTRLRALRRQRPTQHLLTRIATHLDDVDGYLAFSGGKDSLVVLHLALQVDPNVPVVFFDSGLEYPETYTYLAQLQQLWDLNLTAIAARRSTLQILASTGAWDHHTPTTIREDLHHALITEPSQRAHDQHGPGELWGVRASESRGRTALYATQLGRELTDHCHTCCPDQATRRRTHGGLIRRIDGTTAYWGVPRFLDSDSAPERIRACQRSGGSSARSSRLRPCRWSSKQANR